MSYCPKCENGDGEIQWHRRCALVIIGALSLKNAASHANRHHPKE